MQAYVLNDRQRPLPVGVPGRLHVSGACLARGILRRPQQTAERFAANPFFDPFGDPPAFSRMVDTGVLALWRPDGTLEFGGFASHQVCISLEAPSEECCLWKWPLQDVDCAAISAPCWITCSCSLHMTRLTL